GACATPKKGPRRTAAAQTGKASAGHAENSTRPRSSKSGDVGADVRLRPPTGQTWRSAPTLCDLLGQAYQPPPSEGVGNAPASPSTAFSSFFLWTTAEPVCIITINMINMENYNPCC